MSIPLVEIHQRTPDSQRLPTVLLSAVGQIFTWSWSRRQARLARGRVGTRHDHPRARSGNASQADSAAVVLRGRGDVAAPTSGAAITVDALMFVTAVRERLFAAFHQLDREDRTRRTVLAYGDEMAMDRRPNVAMS